MRYFPINLDIRERSVVVIGGGEVAARKIEALREAGAQVSVYDRRPISAIRKLAASKKIRWINRPYRRGDLAEAFMVVAATDDPAVQKAILSEAVRRKILLNVVDRPEFCGFVFPAILKRGEFVVTVSTGGASPALARNVREDLEALFGPEYKTLTDLMGKLREKLPNLPNRDKLFAEIVRSPIRTYIRRGDRGGLDRLLKSFFGEKCGLKSLGVKFGTGEK